MESGRKDYRLEADRLMRGPRWAGALLMAAGTAMLAYAKFGSAGGAFLPALGVGLVGVGGLNLVGAAIFRRRYEKARVERE